MSNIATAPAEPRYRRVLVWERQVRICHWVSAISITVLFATGLFIAWPVLAPPGEATYESVMGNVRWLHFVAGFIFIVNFVFRVYWYFVGNSYQRSSFPQFWRRDYWVAMLKQARAYLTGDFSHPHLGHNALAAMSYGGMIAGLSIVQIVTGLALYGEANPGGFWDTTVGWVLPLLGGSARTHVWHNLVAWGFVVFVIIHLYLVLLTGHKYGNGMVTSIFSGFKFEKVDEPKERED